jgi:hypothetical protein
MKKEEFRELLSLSIYGELNEEEQKKLDAYLQKNPELKNELKELQKMKVFISSNSSKSVSNELLGDARIELRQRIRKERRAQAWWKELFTVRFVKIPQVQFAALALVMFALGSTTTQFVCSPSQSIQQGFLFQTVSNNGTTTDSKTQITNVQFIDADASDGEIEFRFDAIAPMIVKGKIEDPQIQKLLTHALLNEQNAGTRISSVNAISMQSGTGKTIDPQIKSALIESLKKDENPGVRKEALRVLQQFPYDNESRDALLYVLSHDKNIGNRVAAINALDLAKLNGKSFDKNVLESLKQSIKNENNTYVRTKAENLIGEMYQ